MTPIRKKAGDTLEFQIHYSNDTVNTVSDVAMRARTPENIQYVPGSEKLYNTTNPDGLPFSDDNLFTTEGAIVGDYVPRGDAYVRFEGAVADTSLVEGVNQIQMVASATVNNKTLANSVSVYVKK